MKITRRQLRQIIVETIDKIDEQNADLAGFWDHDPDEVVEKDGKLMALGSAPIAPGMTSLARTAADSNARGKIVRHLEENPNLVNRTLKRTKSLEYKKIGNTQYSVVSEF
tara:strand:+ start:108 stop:437 length:330 start_codon:yes stop_codon:yes gene_type:complete